MHVAVCRRAVSWVSELFFFSCGIVLHFFRFQQPAEIRPAAENLGEHLTGDTIENSPYVVRLCACVFPCACLLDGLGCLLACTPCVCEEFISLDLLLLTAGDEQEQLL